MWRRVSRVQSLSSLSSFHSSRQSCAWYTTVVGTSPGHRSVNVTGVGASEPIKETTGLSGVPVIPNARDVLKVLLNETLEELKTLPEVYQYRTIMERATRDRLKVVEENEKITEIERILDMGQIELVIEAVREELTMIPTLKEARNWETSKNHRVKVLLFP